MLQAFGWDSCEAGGWYRIVQDKLTAIQELGVNFAWLPPPSQSVSPQGYMPGQLYDFNTPFGSETDLRALLAALKAARIAPLADIVINHRCADQRDDRGRWNIFTDAVEHPGRRVAWGQWAIVGGDGYGGTGGKDSGDDFGPAPDLDHTNEEVREGLKDWLRYLRDSVGYYGWRLDYVKGYAPSYTKEYIDDTVGCDTFVVGELWADMAWGDEGLEFDQDAARQGMCDYIDGTSRRCPLFDFPTKGILQEAVRNVEYHRLRDAAGKPPGLLGWWPSKAVTFIDNHDTGSTQQHWPFPADRLLAGYAYVLTHPGMPCILWEHAFDSGITDGLKELVALRKRNDLHMRSEINICCAEPDMYVANIDDKVILKMGPRYDMGPHLPDKGKGWHLAASGPDYAVWERRS